MRSIIQDLFGDVYQVTELEYHRPLLLAFKKEAPKEALDELFPLVEGESSTGPLKREH